MSSKLFYGADVSHWQGNISWSAFNPGAAFVFIKAGGGDGSAPNATYVDPQFTANKAGVRALGGQMPHGFYWFGGNGSPTEEAEFFVQNCVSDLQVGEVLVLDSESGAALAPDWCLTWLQVVESQTGVKPLIYMSASRTTAQDWSAVVANGNGLWVADYSVSVQDNVPIAHWPFYAFQQYADNGTFPGISGNVDADAFFAPAITSFLEYGKQPEATPAPLPVAPAPAPPASPVDSGTSAQPTPPTLSEPQPSTGATTPTTPSSTVTITGTVPVTPGTNIDGVKKPITQSPTNTGGQTGNTPVKTPAVTVGEFDKVENWLVRLIKWLKA